MIDSTLVLVVGPAAAGKSAVARALAGELRGGGGTVALVELDAIAAMALPTLPDWALASGIFAAVAGQWLDGPMTFVVAEGVSDPREVAQVRAAVPPGARVLTVALTAPFDTALERALADPTRGVTRDPSHLAGVYRTWEADQERVGADLLIDTSDTSIDATVTAIRNALDP